jgi:Fic family protein
MLTGAEAVSSCAIEGIRSSLTEVFDASTQRDVTWATGFVVNYLAALDAARSTVSATGFDLDTILGVHRRVVGDGGDVRTQQNFVADPGVTDIADAIFVPPPADAVGPLLENWIEWHTSGSASPLAVIAVAHAQFLTIHPFHDGNGRVARVLTALGLVAFGVLRDPTLPISAALGRRRTDYYAALTTLRESGDWEAWVAFFVGCMERAARMSAAAVASASVSDLFAALTELTDIEEQGQAQVTGLHEGEEAD